MLKEDTPDTEKIRSSIYYVLQYMIENKFDIVPRFKIHEILRLFDREMFCDRVVSNHSSNSVFNTRYYKRRKGIISYDIMREIGNVFREINLKNEANEKYSSEKDTKEHIKKVNDLTDIFISKLKLEIEESDNLNLFITKLKEQVSKHDQSKLSPEEKDIFDEFAPKLKHSTYGSEEYKSFLKDMKPALDHHYANNRHHPEFFGGDGIYGMNLVDFIEFFIDNLAATKRHDDGDIFKFILYNAERFCYDIHLANIFWNTAEDVFDEKFTINRPDKMILEDKTLTLIDVVKLSIDYKNKHDVEISSNKFEDEIIEEFKGDVVKKFPHKKYIDDLIADLRNLLYLTYAEVFKG